LGVWTAPGPPETIPKGGGLSRLSPHLLEWFPGPPGTVQADNIDDF
jgi:hypothetical protein